MVRTRLAAKRAREYRDAEHHCEREQRYDGERHSLPRAIAISGNASLSHVDKYQRDADELWCHMRPSKRRKVTKKQNQAIIETPPDTGGYASAIPQQDAGLEGQLPRPQHHYADQDENYNAGSNDPLLHNREKLGSPPLANSGEQEHASSPLPDYVSENGATDRDVPQNDRSQYQMLEGGNKEIPDPLNCLPRELDVCMRDVRRHRAAIASIAADIDVNEQKIDLVGEELLRLTRGRFGSEMSLERVIQLIGPEPENHRVDLHIRALEVGHQRLKKLREQKVVVAQNLKHARRALEPALFKSLGHLLSTNEEQAHTSAAQAQPADAAINMAPEDDGDNVHAETSRPIAAAVASAPPQAESHPSWSPMITSLLSVAGQAAQIDYWSEGQPPEILIPTNKNNANRGRWVAKKHLEECNRVFERHRDSYSERLSFYKRRYDSGPDNTLSRFDRHNLLAGRRVTRNLIEAEQAYSEAATLARQLGAPDCGEGSRFGENEQDEEILRQEEDDHLRHIDLSGVEGWLEDLHPPPGAMDHDSDSRMSAASFEELSDAPFARTLSDIAQGHYARKIDRHHGRMLKAWQDMIDQSELRWHVVDEYGEVFDGGEIPLPRFDGAMSEFSYDHEVEALWYYHWGQRRTYAAELEEMSDCENELQDTSLGSPDAYDDQSEVSYGSESGSFVEDHVASKGMHLADAEHHATESDAISRHDRLER